MSELRISILKGEQAFPSFIQDAKQLNAIPTNKIVEFVDWTVRHETLDISLTEKDATEAAGKFGTTITDLLSALRITLYYFTRGTKVTESDLVSDFQKLGFDSSKAELIIQTLKTAWNDPVAKQYLAKARKEALPELTTIHWRVDVRYASSDYLPEPEAVAIMKLGTNGQKPGSHIHFELDLNELIWLENEIAKMKKELISAQQKLKQS